MRIAYLAPEFLPTWGGVGTYSSELVRNISKEDEVHVITPCRGKGYDKEAILAYFDHRIKIHNISYADDGFFYNFKFQLALLRRFGQLHKRYKFDLVHSANLVHMPDLYLKLFGPKIPSITTVHSTLQSQAMINGKLFGGRKTTGVEGLTKLSYPLLSVLQDFYMSRTQNYIAVSDYIKGSIKKGRVKMIHNGIDTKRFSRMKDGRFHHLRSKKVPLILFSGRLISIKGLDTLIRSMRIVLSREKAFFVFAGSGDIRHWKKMLRGVPEQSYRFLGYVKYEDMHELYSASDIFVLPSYTESLPLTLLEAMSCRNAVIASDVGGVKEIIDHDIDGLLVKPGDARMLADSILAMIRQKKDILRLSNNARKKVERMFDSSEMAEKTREFYHEVVRNK
jgi:glycosyltransferase involved in cell wall biosynthesis